MNKNDNFLPAAPQQRLLTQSSFQQLAEVPPELEWFGNIDNAHTKRSYEKVIRDFMSVIGIHRPEEFRAVTRAHVIRWRESLVERNTSKSTIRHRLSALSSLFEYLCERNAITHNPVKGIKRPRMESNEGKTAALGDHQARALLAAPEEATLLGKRDRAIIATLLYHGLRRQELCNLKVKDAKHERSGVTHLKVQGKGGKTRYVPLHPAAGRLIADYLDSAGHGDTSDSALFRPMKNNRTGTLDNSITPDGVYRIVREYSLKIGCEVGAHSMRATAATNALDHEADIAKVQEWLVTEKL